MLDSVKAWIRETLGPSLKSAHTFLDHWIDRLPPDAGRYCAVGLFVLAGLWVLTLKRDFIYLSAPDRRPWRDLRLWAVLALLPYILIYWWF
jgi:hypothetical protein